VSRAETERGVGEELLRLAVDVARQAGELIVARRRRGVELVGTKSTLTDVVTEADRESETLIRSRLRAARPDDAVLGEEAGDTLGSSGVTWVVDPIDGSVNYLYGWPEFSVSIAAEMGGQVVAGVVHNPSSGETWTASLGAGAHLDGAPIHTTTQDRLDLSLIATGFGYSARRRAAQADTLRRVIVEVRDIRRGGSASLDLCSVATGRCDGYYERGLNPWDRAAGALIAREAGARVGGPHGAPESEALTIAAGPALFDALHDLLVAAGAAEG
jgi:myo-inositol-1(or 4)-monophosphatase